MKQIARTVTLFGLLLALSSACYSKPKDVPGWERTRWGMSDQDIVRIFGSKAEKQPTTELYGSGTLGYVVPGIKLKKQTYAAYFQMDGTGKLSEVHIRWEQSESRLPREDLFQSLESLLTLQYGTPDSRTDERPAETPIKFLRLSRIWRFPTTTVELLCTWDSNYSSNVSIRYFPSNAKAP